MRVAILSVVLSQLSPQDDDAAAEERGIAAEDSKRFTTKTARDPVVWSALLVTRAQETQRDFRLISTNVIRYRVWFF